MNKIISAVGLFACMTAFAAPTISDLKVTPIAPLGLAIDFTIENAKAWDEQRAFELLLDAGYDSVGGTNTFSLARTFIGETKCVNGAHRVYWNMAADGFDCDRALVIVKYKALDSEVRASTPLYCVVDLSRYGDVAEFFNSDIGFNADEYKKTKLVLRRVEAGSFIMGKDQTDESHRVTISKSFYMSIFEITQAQWTSVYGWYCSNPSKFSGDTRPVERVSYDMIRGSQEGAQWPTSSDVNAPSFLYSLRLQSYFDFDLPTEAQWEYACRAGSRTNYNLGDYEFHLGLAGWYNENSDGMTHPVGGKEPNGWGFYDMHGNVWEWTRDWSGDLAYGTDPVGASSSECRMLRGGGYETDTPLEASSWGRENDDYPSCKDASDYGFRVVMSVPTIDDLVNSEDREWWKWVDKMLTLPCDGEIDGDVELTAAPTATQNAILKVDGQVVLDTDKAATYVWTPRKTGLHTITHTVGDRTISATYNVVHVHSKITYDNLKGATTDNPATYQEGEALTFDDPTAVVGYTFAGWTPSSITADMTGDQTVMANWTANTYTIKYDANGGKGSMTSATATYDSDATISTNRFVRKGYKFLGWATVRNGDVVYKAGETVLNLVADQNGSMTLYAVWTDKAEILDAKTTPVIPWGLAIDYVAKKVEVSDPMRQIAVSMSVNGTNYVAKNLLGETHYANGSHRVYWNMAKDGISLDTTDAEIEMKYDFAPYCVIDLSNGSAATSYSVAYLDAEPNDGFNTDEYKMAKLVLKRVDAGSFKMQNKEIVILTQPFYMGLFEVTQKQWELVMGSNPSCFTTDGAMKPVEQVSYDMIRGSVKGASWPASDAVDGEAEGDTEDSFLGRLRKRTGIKFDLPTEAQWEYACRAGTTTTYSYGDSADNEYMWCRDNASSETHEVGTKKPNPWGFYDMHGNAYEWCLDWHGGWAYGTDPLGSSSGSNRVRCGGSWYWNGSGCQSNSYYTQSPSRIDNDCGFRLSWTIP